MAFRVHTTDDGRVPGLEYLPCGAITPKAGMAMKMTAGKLAAATAKDLPIYLSMAERETPCAAGELIPVIRMQPDIALEADTPAGATAVPGDKVQLGAGGLTLTKTTGGTAEIVYTDETVTRVRFVQPDATA